MNLIHLDSSFWGISMSVVLELACLDTSMKSSKFELFLEKSISDVDLGCIDNVVILLFKSLTSVQFNH